MTTNIRMVTGEEGKGIRAVKHTQSKTSVYVLCNTLVKNGGRFHGGIDTLPHRGKRSPGVAQHDDTATVVAATCFCLADVNLCMYQTNIQQRNKDAKPRIIDTDPHTH